MGSPIFILLIPMSIADFLIRPIGNSDWKPELKHEPIHTLKCTYTEQSLEVKQRAPQIEALDPSDSDQ